MLTFSTYTKLSNTIQCTCSSLFCAVDDYWFRHDTTYLVEGVRRSKKRSFDVVTATTACGSWQSADTRIVIVIIHRLKIWILSWWKHDMSSWVIPVFHGVVVRQMKSMTVSEDMPLIVLPCIRVRPFLFPPVVPPENITIGSLKRRRWWWRIVRKWRGPGKKRTRTRRKRRKEKGRTVAEGKSRRKREWQRKH